MTVKAQIKSFLVSARSPGLALASCGRCGQRLWKIEDAASPPGQVMLMEEHTSGYRYDASAGVWRPTPKALAKRLAAREHIRLAQARPDDAALVNGAAQRHGQRGRNIRISDRSAVMSGDIRALLLPTKIECRRCGEVNTVEMD